MSVEEERIQHSIIQYKKAWLTDESEKDDEDDT